MNEVRTMITLAELHYQFGLIGVDEFTERVSVAQWVCDEVKNGDPRLPETVPDDEADNLEERETELQVTIKEGSREKDWIEFLFDRKWFFTISDPDHYPSIPHGHLNSQNHTWPKLNPYTGRVFKEKHQEDISMRLSRSKMRSLWQDNKFRSFCRDHIIWYMETYPHYKFPVKFPLRFPRG